MRKILFAAVATAALVSGFAIAAELKSGPQAGDKLPGAFHPLNCTGEDSGKKACLVCKHGTNPVAMVFARCAECPQTVKLIKAIDAATKKNEKAGLCSFAVFLSDDDKMGEKLKELAAKEHVGTCTLAVDNPSGPEAYHINKDADVTVILYVEHKVKANHTFKKGSITDEGIEAVVKDLKKILPEAK